MSDEAMKMVAADEAKKISSGAAAVKFGGDDRKSLAAAPAPSLTPTAADGRKIVIKSADMKSEVQKEAVDIAIAAFEKYNVEKDVAEHIKKQFDKKYGPTWHCIVGKNFGSYVTHETNHFVYFYLDSKAVLLFKSG